MSRLPISWDLASLSYGAMEYPCRWDDLLGWNLAIGSVLNAARYAPPPPDSSPCVHLSRAYGGNECLECGATGL